MCRPVDGVVLRQLLEDGISIDTVTASIEYFLDAHRRGSEFGLNEVEILQEMYLQGFYGGLVAAEQKRNAPIELSDEEIEAASVQLATYFHPRASGASPS